MRTTTKQKMLRFLFWTVLLYTACTTTVVIGIQFQIIPIPNRPVVKADSLTKKANDANLQEITFAKRFVREYLSWSKGTEDSRATRLKPFWAQNMDIQGGMDFSQLKWNSYPQNIEVWKVKERAGGEGIKEIVVYAETILINDEKDQAEKRVDRYLTVSIKQAGESFRVVDQPTFQAPPLANELKLTKNEEKNTSEVTIADQQKIESFMLSFWKTYTQDSPNEIRYLMKNNQTTSGLTGIMRFLELQKVETTKDGDQYITDCDVLLEDLASGVQIVSQYKLRLVNENGRWLVSDIKPGEEK